MAGRDRTVETGAASTEYALLAVLIAVVVILGVTALGMGTRALYQGGCESIAAHSPGSTC